MSRRERRRRHRRGGLCLRRRGRGLAPKNRSRSASLEGHASSWPGRDGARPSREGQAIALGRMAANTAAMAPGRVVPRTRRPSALRLPSGLSLSSSLSLRAEGRVEESASPEGHASSWPGRDGARPSNGRRGRATLRRGPDATERVPPMGGAGGQMIPAGWHGRLKSGPNVGPVDRSLTVAARRRGRIRRQWPADSRGKFDQFRAPNKTTSPQRSQRARRPVSHKDNSIYNLCVLCVLCG
jgi:hypothetical protein